MRYGVFLLTLLLGLHLAVAAHAMDWEIRSVDKDGNAGYRASIAIDSQGRPHVIYMDETSQAIRYAVRDGGIWSKSFVRGWDRRMGPDALILPGDIPAFTFAGAFVSRPDQTWVFEDMGNDGFWMSAARLGSDGVVYGISQGSIGSGAYIGYVDVVERHNGTWSNPHRLLTTAFYPNYPSASVAVGATQDLYVSLTTHGGEPLRYCHRASGVWSIEPLGPGLWSSIALDSHESPRISFYDQNAMDLVMATRANGAWVLTHLDQTGDVGLYTSQGIWNDISYVSYYDHTNGNLMLATFTDPEHFTVTPIDVDGDVGAWTSLAIDAQGRPYIAYQDVTNGALKVAVGNAPLPVRKVSLGTVKSLYRR